MDVPEYRVWMYNRLGPNRVGLTEEFYNGVEEFIQFACVNNADFPSTGTIRCPCVKCKCTKFKVLDEVRKHLYRVGFQPRYYYWTAHGEVQPEIHPVETQVQPNNATNYYCQGSGIDNFNSYEQIVMDVVGPNVGDDLLQNFGCNEQYMNEPPNPEAQIKVYGCPNRYGRNSESVWEELRTHWNSSEYLQKRELGKKNRSSQTSGCLHSGGCIPHSKHQKRLRQELGCDPTYHDIFRHTHVKNGTHDQFIDPRSATINDSFVKLKDTSSQALTSDTDGCEQQPINENEIFLQATVGMSKKGRVYGIGSKARRLCASSSSSSSSIRYFGLHSQNFYLQQEIEERITRMNAELRDLVDTQQQHIVEQDRKMEAMERMVASQQQMMQQYFARKEVNPQPPTDYPEDNLEARNEGEDKDDDIN